MIVAGVLMILISLLFAFLSYRQFSEKGVLLNNAYLYASESERKEMNKTPHYLQSGFIFALLSAVFFADAVYALAKIKWLLAVVFTLIGLTVAFAVVSSILIAKYTNNKH